MPQGQQKGPPPGGGKAKRRMKNYMLQPLLQVKLGVYAIGLSVLFSVAVGLILYSTFGDIVNSIVLMTDAEDEVREIMMAYAKGAMTWVALSFVVYLGATIGVSVLYTHKLIGPTIAFRRHVRSIAEGRYNARTYLRKGDAFAELADELNHLSEVMERKSAGK
jgi:hypothetical protein